MITYLQRRTAERTSGSLMSPLPTLVTRAAQAAVLAAAVLVMAGCGSGTLPTTVPSGTLPPLPTREAPTATATVTVTKAASTVMGSGWGALAWEPAGKRLITTQIHDHQSETAQSSVPLLVLDAWEHAWYLQYKTDKVKFFEALWNVFNWKDVEARFASASKLDLGLRNVVAG